MSHHLMMSQDGIENFDDVLKYVILLTKMVIALLAVYMTRAGMEIVELFLTVI